MGDPKFSRKKYKNPPHPWQLERIQMENEYVKYYGLKNKKEFWKSRSVLKNIRSQARNLQARLRFGDSQAKKEVDELIDKLTKNGYLVGEELTLNDVLNLTVENVLNRRLQTVVYHKGLASSTKQARQLITHGHISVVGRRITVPSYILSREEESDVTYDHLSPLNDELHPVRPKDDVSPTYIPEQMKKDKEKESFKNRRRRR